jgi:hypothetical protein
MLDSIILSGDVVSTLSGAATVYIKALTYDQDGDILSATGTDLPDDAQSGFAKGCVFIDTDVATGSTGVYINIGTNASCSFKVSPNVLSGDVTVSVAGVSAVATVGTATAAEIIAASDTSVQAALVSPSTVMAAKIQSAVHRRGNIIKTEIAVNLVGLKTSGTLADILGDTGVCHIGRITTAVNGVIYKGQLSCGVVPTTGDDDIDVYKATVATGEYNDDVTGLAGAGALLTSAGALAIGTRKPFTALPAPNDYLYLAGGDTTAGTYDAGRIFIELWGTVA